MKLVLDTITSRTGPRSSPSRCISSITIRATDRTNCLVCQDRLTPSHFSGVVTMTSAEAMACESGTTSPVSSTTNLPSLCSSLTFQSFTLSHTNAFSGAMYTTFISEQFHSLLLLNLTTICFTEILFFSRQKHFGLVGEPKIDQKSENRFRTSEKDPYSYQSKN